MEKGTLFDGHPPVKCGDVYQTYPYSQGDYLVPYLNGFGNESGSNRLSESE